MHCNTTQSSTAAPKAQLLALVKSMTGPALPSPHSSPGCGQLEGLMYCPTLICHMFIKLEPHFGFGCHF